MFFFCIYCQYFFCAKCDTAIHDRNKFFREHVRQDARKPFKVMRSHVHNCIHHDDRPYVKYDTTAASDMEKPMCTVCIENNEAAVIKKMHEDEGAIKDYAQYRKELMDKIKLQVESLSRVSDKQLALYQVMGRVFVVVVFFE